MSTPTEQVIAKIKELGDAAPEYFARSAPTIKGWVATGKVPLFAYEILLDKDPPLQDETVEAFNAVPSDFEARLSKIEAFMARNYAPAAPVSPLTRPAGPRVVSKPGVSIERPIKAKSNIGLRDWNKKLSPRR